MVPRDSGPPAAFPTSDLLFTHRAHQEDPRPYGKKKFDLFKDKKKSGAAVASDGTSRFISPTLASFFFFPSSRTNQSYPHARTLCFFL